MSKTKTPEGNSARREGRRKLNKVDLSEKQRQNDRERERVELFTVKEGRVKEDSFSCVLFPVPCFRLFVF